MENKKYHIKVPKQFTILQIQSEKNAIFVFDVNSKRIMGVSF